MDSSGEIEAALRGPWLDSLPAGEWPVVVEPLRDAPAPGEAYARLCDRVAPFWLDSAQNVSDHRRHSFVGCDPLLLFRSKGDGLSLVGAGPARRWRGDPFRAVSALLSAVRLRPLPDAPPLVGGAVGYFGYDLRTHVEQLPRIGRDDLGADDVVLGFYGAVIAYDHVHNRATLCYGEPWRRQAASLRELLRHEGPSLPDVPSPLAGALRSNFRRAAYLEAVERVLEYIAAGHIYQVNLSQRFSARLAAPCRTPRGRLALYHRLRERTPAPYGALLDFAGIALLSASPERFLRISGREAETRPIKGTRRRGRTPDEDSARARELLESPKDRAELLMIVDLERNDLGRVCEYGSVHVPELFRLEAHPTVYHLVATVRGRLRPDVGPAECLRACFPGGSITGAPKIRAMEIIEELEPTHRGPYTGAIGYLGWNGETDLNIVIRTMTLLHDHAHFQVGGGIVADSDPAAEYEETLDKGRALAGTLGTTDTLWSIR
jgi:para-aminobenzoate synthetase component 1